MNLEEYAIDYTLDELVVTTLSRQLRDGEVVFTGVASPIPIIAILLAQKTHAPNLTWINVLGGVDARPSKLPFSTGDPVLLEGIVGAVELPETFDLSNRGKIDVIIFGGVQIDQFCNINMSVIGDYSRPKVRLPGGAGVHTMIKTIKRVLIFRPVHTKRLFVENVDFKTGPGWIPEAEPRRGGPEKIITNLCVMAFDKEVKKIRLESVHPGISVDDVINNTGFELIIPETVPETEPPTKNHVFLLREKIDPEGIRKSAF